MRRLLTFVLILLMPLQALHAAVGDWLEFDSDEGVHWVDHDVGISHHHLDDGQVQHDNSDASLQHMNDHGLCHVSTAMLTSTPVIHIGLVVGSPPAQPDAVRRADPDLKDPTRPPQTLSRRLSA